MRGQAWIRQSKQFSALRVAGERKTVRRMVAEEVTGRAMEGRAITQMRSPIVSARADNCAMAMTVQSSARRGHKEWRSQFRWAPFVSELSWLGSNMSGICLFVRQFEFSLLVSVPAINLHSRNAVTTLLLDFNLFHWIFILCQHVSYIRD